MTRTRAVVLLFIALIVAVAAPVPATRDELSWWWADMHDHAADFMSYLDAWPKGRHAAEARFKYNQRHWVETQKAMIRQAYQNAAQANPEADNEYRRQQHARRETFFWKQATNANTLESYQSYLRQFPRGQFIRQAHAEIDALNHRPKEVPPINTPPPQ